MRKLFDYPHVDVYEYDDLPIGYEMYMLDEKWLTPLNEAFREPGAVYDIAPVITIIPNSRAESAIEFTIYNVLSRHHRLPVVLPRSEFVIAAGSASFGIKPFVFVRSEWYETLCSRRYSMLVLVDAAGVKERLRTGTMTVGPLLALRAEIDQLAKAHPEVAFVSFADNVLLKFDWTFGHYENNTDYTYEPEALLRLIPDVSAAFKKSLDLPVYTIVTQGENFYDDALPIYVASTANHTSLNVLGAAFAQLFGIDRAVRGPAADRGHSEANLYLADTVFYSLRFKYGFDRSPQTYRYSSGLSHNELYICADLNNVLANLRDSEIS